MYTDSMTTMQSCNGDSCDAVPIEVVDAVLDSLEQVPHGSGALSRRDEVAKVLAPRMAIEGWRFCPCYSLLRTEQHTRIFDLVHTDLANRLAHQALIAMVA